MSGTSATGVENLDALAHSDQVRRYVLQQLEPAEQARFEQALIASASLQQAVEAEFALHEAAASLPEVVAERRSPAARSWSSWALAASLLLGVGLGVGLARWPAIAPMPVAGAAQALSFTQLRGADAPLRQAEAGRLLVVRLLTGNDAPHQLSVRHADGDLLWQQDDLLANAEGELIVVMGPFAAQQEPLELELRGGGRSDHYRLQIQ